MHRILTRVRFEIGERESEGLGLRREMEEEDAMEAAQAGWRSFFK